MDSRKLIVKPEKANVFVPTRGVAYLVLFIGLLLTSLLVYITYSNLLKAIKQEVEFESMEVQIKFESRLRSQTQILRNGAGLFAVSDTVTREDWNAYYVHSRISIHYPGIQGFGYTQVIPPHLLQEHIQSIRESGFPEYTVTPEYEREFYTAIIYLEPFEGRNLRAFGFDMYSEPVRRQAMQAAVDSNFAVLSGKVTLVQETDEDVQPGFLIYVPVYHNNMPLNTVAERRAAIKGWVYSPYRIKDLAEGVFQQWQSHSLPSIRFRIYDGDSVNPESLMFDSYEGLSEGSSGMVFTETLPIRLNENTWTLVTTSESSQLLYNGNLLFVFFTGITISLLMFFLTTSLINAHQQTQRIQQLNLQLGKLNADKDRFISILGHDLKNPFNNMLGFLDILSRDLNTLEKEKVENFIAFLNDVAKNTYKLLDDLLKWARVQTGNFPFDPRNFSFASAFREVYGHLHSFAHSKDITLINANEEDLTVYGDYEMFKTILRNLISNAIKFSNPGGEVRVKAEKENDQIVVRVADKGIGVDGAKMQKLFVITEIVTTKGTADEKGTGLGLILCKEFVEVHGGTIWMESEPGKGSQVSFTLPLQGS
jgi:signal transduction histidine kinase